MMVGIAFLIVFFSAAVMPGQSQNCITADWTISFHRKGVSTCQRKTEYIRGFYRREHKGDDPISLLKLAKCCSRDAAFSDSPSQVVFSNWTHSFDRGYTWNLCPPGFFLQGLYRDSGSGGLWLIDDGVCSKPATHPRKYGDRDCIVLDVSFKDKGWSTCPTGYFVTGLYRGRGGYLEYLDKFRCCKMASGPAPLTSHDDVKTRVMDTTQEEISYLAHYLGYAWPMGCRGRYVGVGTDFQRHGDTWVADQTIRCDGYKPHGRLRINYGDWSFELKNITFSKEVITNLTAEVLDSGLIINNSSTNSMTSIEHTEEVVRSVTHTKTGHWKSSHDMGITIGFSLPLLNMVSPTFGASYNFRYETSNSTTDSTGKEQKRTFTVNQRKTILPYSAVDWKLVLLKNRTTVSYTATVIPRFSVQLSGFMKRGHGWADIYRTNYHHKYRGSEDRPNFPYRFGSSSTPFYRALKQESGNQNSDPWKWMDMKTAHPGAQSYIDNLTNEKRYEMTLTGRFEEIEATDFKFIWNDVPVTTNGGRYRRRSAPHNGKVFRTVAKAQDWDPPSVFPDPPQVQLDPGL